MDEGFTQEMVERVPWLRPIDYDILDWLCRHEEIDDGFTANPSTIAANIDYNNRYIANRTKDLAEAGFLDRTSGPKYSLTGLGRRLLNSELDADEVPDEPSSD